MVLESFTNPLSAENHPKRMILYGIGYTSVAMLLAIWIFRPHASLIMVFLTTLAAVPLMYATIKFEEKKDLEDLPEERLLREHMKALSSFFYLFVGIMIAYAFWFAVLPTDILHDVFRVQIDTFSQINPGATGFSTAIFNEFIKILSNNFKVLIFCLLFSFLYGAGAIFILTWNASVIGFAIGKIVREELVRVSTVVGWEKVAGYFQIVSYGLLRYSMHGIPEILAYFVGGLAGGIISVAVIRHDFGTKNYEKLILDSSVLLFFSFLLLIAAAFIEVFITPLIFV